MDRRPTQISRLNKFPHTPGDGTELVVVTRCQLESPFFREIDKFLRLVGIDRKGFFYIDVYVMLEAELS
jgi:hypothetical protein